MLPLLDNVPDCVSAIASVRKLTLNGAVQSVDEKHIHFLQDFYKTFYKTLTGQKKLCKEKDLF